MQKNAPTCRYQYELAVGDSELRGKPIPATFDTISRTPPRTNLTSRQMNGRLVRKTLSFSKELEMLEASSVWEDAAYNLTRQVKTLRLEVNEEKRRFQQRSPAMAAGLTDHIWQSKNCCGRWLHPVNQLKAGRPPESGRAFDALAEFL